MTLGDNDRALQNYDQAIALDPNYAIAYVNRAVVHAQQGNYDRAIRDLDQAIALDPNDGLAYVNRGECLPVSR